MRRLILDRDSAYRGDTPCRAARATPSGRGRLVRGLRPWVLLYHAAGRVAQLGAGSLPEADNALFDNDGVKTDLQARIDRLVGPKRGAWLCGVL